MEGGSSISDLKKFAEMIGEQIGLMSPVIGKGLKRVILRGVETGGLWVESQEITQTFLDDAKVYGSPRSLAIFVPFAQIMTVLSSIDEPSVSEKEVAE